MPLDPKLNAVFHVLWTKAVGTPDYVKAEWQTLEGLILELERRARHPHPEPYPVRSEVGK